MISFKILTSRLPVKWQAELREVLGSTAAPSPATTKDEKGPAPEITVAAENVHVIDDLLHWIQRMNRPQKNNKNAIPNEGVSLAIQRADGGRIVLTERNASVVKQFLSS